MSRDNDEIGLLMQESIGDYLPWKMQKCLARSKRTRILPAFARGAVEEQEFGSCRDCELSSCLVKGTGHDDAVKRGVMIESRTREACTWDFPGRTGIRRLVLSWAALLASLLASQAGDLTNNISRAPCAASEVIAGIRWDWNTYRTGAPGSDLWPVTWGPDGQLYAAWGDGGGFGGTDSDGRVALGFARIEGTPENWRGINLNGGKNPAHPASFPKKGKTTGIAFVDGVLYATVNLEDGKWPDVDHVLAWSTNYAATWDRAAWRFPKGTGNFHPAKFLTFGQNYDGVPPFLAGYVYFYGPRQPAGGRIDDRLYFARAAKNRLRERSAYEFFFGTNAT